MKKKRARNISLIFLFLIIIFLFVIMADALWGERYLGYTGSFVICLILFCLCVIGIIFMYYFSIKSGGSMYRIGRLTLTEIPPKIVNPTISTKIQCPFECTCEKHYGAPNEGIDIAPQVPGVAGDPVYAVTKGKVKTTNDLLGIVELDCEMFIITYRDLVTIICKAGTKVKRGAEIGTMGDKGTKEGIHLHIEFWHKKSKTYVDPLMYYDWGTEQEEL